MFKYIFTLALVFTSFNVSAQETNASSMLAKTTFKDLYNQDVLLKDYNIPYRSGLLVNIWATWCKPCVEELPSLMKLQAKTQDITVVALSVDRHPKIVKNFLRRNRIPESVFVNLIDVSGKKSKALGYSKVPTTLLIDNKGKIVDVFIGPRKWDSDFMVASLKASLEKASKDTKYYY